MASDLHNLKLSAIQIKGTAKHVSANKFSTAAFEARLYKALNHRFYVGRDCLYILLRQQHFFKENFLSRDVGEGR